MAKPRQTLVLPLGRGTVRISIRFKGQGLRRRVSLVTFPKTITLFLPYTFSPYREVVVPLEEAEGALEAILAEKETRR